MCGAESPGLGERAEDDERDSAAERELGEIERELDELALALPAGDDQGDEGAYELPDQQGRRRAEQQAEREPDLRQRKRVRLLAELEVNDEDLGEVERECEGPPGQMRAGHERRAVEVVDRERPHERAGEREDTVEDPDPARRAKSLTHSDAERARRLARRWARGKRPGDHRPLPLRVSPSSLQAMTHPTSCCRSSSSHSSSSHSTSSRTRTSRSTSYRSTSYPTTRTRSTSCPTSSNHSSSNHSSSSRSTSYPTRTSRSTCRQTSWTGGFERRHRCRVEGLAEDVLLALEHDAVQRDVVAAARRLEAARAR